MKQIRNRVRRITRELSMLQEDLATAQRQPSSDSAQEILTPEAMTEFKSCVDALRRLLWLSAPAPTSVCSPNTAHVPTELQAPRGVWEQARISPRWSGGSFIEKVEAIVERKIPLQQPD
jgi:hypothetical protein